jgi:hypothetical protein
MAALTITPAIVLLETVREDATRTIDGGQSKN